MIENFLTFSRIERNRQKFTFAPTPVAGVIERAVTAMGERLQPPSCDLELAVSDRVAPVAADEDALVTVMVNLLDNACKYSPGRKKISVSASGAEGSVILLGQRQRHWHRTARAPAHLPALLPGGPAAGARDWRLRPGPEHRPVRGARPRWYGARRQPARRRQHLQHHSAVRGNAAGGNLRWPAF